MTQIALAAGLTAWLLSAATATAQRPNILLLMTDQMRADCVGAEGNRIIHTPALDRLAAEGARFRCAYSSTPSCTPARAALLTGLSPWNHGMLGYGRMALRYKHEMPAMLRDAGYYTLGIGKMHFNPQRNLHGFHRTILDESSREETPEFRSDYHAWFYSMAPALDPDVTHIGWNDYQSAAYALPEELHPTRWIADVAVNFIKSYDRPEPFFLKVSFERPHSPYDPPARLAQMYENTDVPSAAVGDWAGSNAKGTNPSNRNSWHGDFGAEQVRKSRRAYYASVTFVDEQIARILKTLEDREQLDNTLILFTADHGDMLGDHHLWRKTYAYESSAHIPMIVRWPKSLQAQRGQVLSQPVELRDVMPTFLEAAGVAFDKKAFDGRSVLELVRGDARGWRKWIDLEHAACYKDAGYWNALTDGRTKYIHYGSDEREYLFDLEKDPQELHDLVRNLQSQDTLHTWRERLVQHLSQRGESFVRDGALTSPRPNVLYGPKFPKSTGEAISSGPAHEPAERQ